MKDTSALLSELKIDRGGTEARPARRWPWLLLPAGLLLLALIWWQRGPAPIPVETVSVSRAATSARPSVLDASGYVIARRQATVSSKVTGKVIELLIEEGQAVAEGDVLARLDPSNARAQLRLAQAQRAAAAARLLEIEVQLIDARRQHDRTRELAARNLASQQALDAAAAQADALAARLEAGRHEIKVAQRQVEIAQQNVDDTIVRAPFAGVITIKNAQPGEIISPLSAGGAGIPTGIGTLVDMDSLEIEVDVNENFINRISAGQPVTAELNAYPDWTIPARVIAVVPAADRSKATVRVRVGLDLSDARILPDMGVRVAFMDATANTETGVSALVVPARAVSRDGGSDGWLAVVFRDGWGGGVALPSAKR